MMVLKRFRVTNFRSVDDSDWIDVDDVTALIGTNEAGKTNILLPLWKFNPAKEGAIVATADYPRKRFSTYRTQKDKPVFIRAVFEVDDMLAAQLASKTGMPIAAVRTVEVARDLDGKYEVDFPNANPARSIDKARVRSILDAAEHDVTALTPLKTEEDLTRLLITSIKTAIDALPQGDELTASDLDSVVATLDGVKTDGAPKTSVIVPRHKQATDELRSL